MNELTEKLMNRLDQMNSDAAELAVRNVLVLHRANPGSHGPWCDHCGGDYDGSAPWPCATVQHIAQAFEAM